MGRCARLSYSRVFASELFAHEATHVHVLGAAVVTRGVRHRCHPRPRRSGNQRGRVRRVRVWRHLRRRGRQIQQYRPVPQAKVAVPPPTPLAAALRRPVAPANLAEAPPARPVARVQATLAAAARRRAPVMVAAAAAAPVVAAKLAAVPVARALARPEPARQARSEPVAAPALRNS